MATGKAIAFAKFVLAFLLVVGHTACGSRVPWIAGAVSETTRPTSSIAVAVRHLLQALTTAGNASAPVVPARDGTTADDTPRDAAGADPGSEGEAGNITTAETIPLVDRMQPSPTLENATADTALSTTGDNSSADSGSTPLVNSSSSTPPVNSSGSYPPVNSSGSTPPVNSSGSTPPVNSSGSTPPVNSSGSTPPVDTTDTQTTVTALPPPSSASTSTTTPTNSCAAITSPSPDTIQAITPGSRELLVTLEASDASAVCGSGPQYSYQWSVRNILTGISSSSGAPSTQSRIVKVPVGPGWYSVQLGVAAVGGTAGTAASADYTLFHVVDVAADDAAVTAPREVAAVGACSDGSATGTQADDVNATVQDFVGSIVPSIVLTADARTGSTRVCADASNSSAAAGRNLTAVSWQLRAASEEGPGGSSGSAERFASAPLVPGSYYLVLTVQDDAGSESSTAVLVRVLPSAPAPPALQPPPSSPPASPSAPEDGVAASQQPQQQPSASPPVEIIWAPEPVSGLPSTQPVRQPPASTQPPLPSPPPATTNQLLVSSDTAAPSPPSPAPSQPPAPGPSAVISSPPEGALFLLPQRGGNYNLTLEGRLSTPASPQAPITKNKWTLRGQQLTSGCTNGPWMEPQTLEGGSVAVTLPAGVYFVELQVSDAEGRQGTASTGFSVAVATGAGAP